jgi:hypothetical protein
MKPKIYPEIGPKTATENRNSEKYNLTKRKR